jgi:hypothetical protein
MQKRNRRGGIRDGKCKMNQKKKKKKGKKKRERSDKGENWRELERTGPA